MKPSLAEFLHLAQSLLAKESEEALPFPEHLDRFVEHVEGGGRLVLDGSPLRRAGRMAQAEVQRMYALAAEASERHAEMAAGFTDKATRAATVLHPTGACTCAGEGACIWCRTHCPDCGSTPRHAGPCERPTEPRRWKRGQKRNLRQRHESRARHAGTVRAQKAQALLRREHEAWPGRWYTDDQVDAVDFALLAENRVRVGGLGILRPEMTA